MARSTKQKRTFVFRKHQVIGAADAIDDQKYLLESFVDNGELDILMDISDPRCIIVGRTGSGKTALLVMLESQCEKVIKITPGDVALNHIANSSTLRFFASAGVKLDLFYSLLWRHVFAVEIIREHYHIVNEQARDNFVQRMIDGLTKNKNRRDAIKYLLEMGESFWLDSEYRIKEVTQTLEQKLENSIEGSIKAKIPSSAELDVKGRHIVTNNLTTEEKADVIRFGQPVVDEVQMRKLGQVIEVIENDILVDKQKRYYVVIDQLDENWVNDDLRYHLIKALIDTVRDFNGRIANLKIVVAIREDLLDRVFRYARGSGYQEEKYRSMYVILSWKFENIEDLLNRRVERLVKDQYTSQRVGVRDLLPNRIDKGDPVSYLVDRTLLRPRDAIMFFNECINAAEGTPKLTQEAVHRAEGVYSEQRLRALADEWFGDYQNLIELAMVLKAQPSKLRLRDLAPTVELMLLNLSYRPGPVDIIHVLAQENFNNGDYSNFLREAILILFRVGIIGIKPESYNSPRWSYLGHRLIREDLNEEAIIYIHPAFWRVLGTRPAS